MEMDLSKGVGMAFDVPIFLVTGKYDWHTPKILSDECLADIDPPHKELVEFGESSHYLINEELGKVLVNSVNRYYLCAANSSLYYHWKSYVKN